MNTLTIEDLEAAVPAAFATEPADRVSSRYSFINTRDIVEQVMSRGWMPVRASQSRRVLDTRHATHMITFRRPDDKPICDAVPQLYMVNNHMALHRFIFYAGLFKFICSNGVVISLGVGETRMNRIHIDKASVEVEESLIAAIAKTEEALSLIPRWAQLSMTSLQQNEFASKAVLIRNNNDPYWSAHFDAHEFLNRRRDADRRHDLWTVFNVVQENIMQGGVPGATHLTRPITQVVEVQRINTGLWQLATEYGKTHGVN